MPTVNAPPIEPESPSKHYTDTHCRHCNEDQKDRLEVEAVINTTKLTVYMISCNTCSKTTFINKDKGSGKQLVEFYRDQKSRAFSEYD